MKLLYAVFFGAGVAGVAYSRLGRRVGYGNQANVWTITGIMFVLVSIIFFTILSTVPSD
jgi:multidrug transporter EmrE-like cation transporter